MKELVLLMAKIAPEEVLVDKLDEQVKEYKLCPTPDNFKKLATSCMFILTKVSMGDKDLFESIDELNKAERAQSLLTPNKQ